MGEGKRGTRDGETDRPDDGEVRRPVPETPLLDTVREPRAIEDLDGEGEPSGDNFA